MKSFSHRFTWIVIGICIIMLSGAIVNADFYVVATGKKAKKTLLVSPQSTQTASGTVLLNTVNGITDAGETNSYLIIVEPGVYNIGSNSLNMKSYVDLQGSGENVTKITGNISSENSGVLRGADHSEIRFITIENSGGSASAIAVYNANASPKMFHMTAVALGVGDASVGIYNNLSSSPEMVDVTASASGAAYNSGVYNYDSSNSQMTHVTATASGGTYSYGIYSWSSSPKMSDITASASGGGTNYGIVNSFATSTIEMMNIKATASGGSTNSAVYNASSSCKIDHSVLTGDPALFNGNVSGETVYVGTTRLNGGTGGIGSKKCAAVYNASFTFYPDTCP